MEKGAQAEPTPMEKDVTSPDVTEKSVEGPSNTEYEEYLELDRHFRGERLAKLIRKIDWHVLPQLIPIYLVSYVDRTNVVGT
ncbi:hypothetical protein FQN53_008292 [Emmonsiellopsis sp. PD_33]|nr:hypothetical protein FQN53_008292 [Emmonsiellopsis sp. PD_33]